MKKLFISLLLAGLAVLNVAGQQRLKNQYVINASGNYIFNDAWGARVGLEKFLGTSYSSLHVNFMYNHLKYITNVEGEKARSQMFLANAAYGYSLEKVIPTPFYINFSLGAVAGYEDIDVTLKTSVTDVKSKFVWGFNVNTQFEYILYKQLSLYLEPEFIYLLNSDTEKGLFSLGLGMKFYW